MKFALISDVHGNLEALESVLRDIEKQGVEKIHFLGDAVGYGCNPNQCVSLIHKHCDVKLLGNHDYAVMGLEQSDNFNQVARASMDWTVKKIKKKSIQILADFEMSSTFLDYYLVHASPEDPESWTYILDINAAQDNFDKFSQSVCLIGHTHVPECYILDKDGTVAQKENKSLIRQDGYKYIVNIGSVGQPRDNDPRSCYLIVDTDTDTMYYRRVEYDIGKTQEKMKKAKLPEFLIERLATGV
jgi:diadenosine tetraphosphatase ApaH/serine/threonine PP2A family protein phosphatase